MKHHSLLQSKFVAGAAFLAALGMATSALAWTGPSSSPPAGNVSAPLNVGATAQSKSAGLVLNTGGAANGLIVQFGNVGIDNAAPGYPLDVTGTVRATAFLYSSDRTLKTNIVPLSNALAKIEQLQGVSFNWKDTGRPDVGLIAQDVQTVYPEVVQKSSTTGLLSVAYGNLVAPLVEAVKALAHHDTDQDAQIAALQAQVADLQAQIAALKNSR